MKKKLNIKNGMESITELYKIGRGPSSSHTMGPEKACKIFKEKNPSADRFKAILYGSLSKTGKGHATDVLIEKTFAPVLCNVIFNFEKKDLAHPNTMELYAYKGTKLIDSDTILSVGGGKIVYEDEEISHSPLIYPLTKFDQIHKVCSERGILLWEYAKGIENADFGDYMYKIWEQMKATIYAGLEDTGILPGGLEIEKKAKYLYNTPKIDESTQTRENRLVCSYAFAVGEQNACGKIVVTAPTCGAAGVLPAVLYYQQKENGYTNEETINALITGGIIGNLVKTNAIISGAEGGCQAEIGTACAMASAALGELFGLSIGEIEYAAEIAIEHHLGLTCDPICGLVQIPCIERNAVAAMRAINAVNLASFLSDSRKITLDDVIIIMKETGRDIDSQYRETSEGGLANIKL